MFRPQSHMVLINMMKTTTLSIPRDQLVRVVSKAAMK